MEISQNSIFLLNNQFYKVYKRLISSKSKNESTKEDIEWITSQLTSENRRNCENAVNVLTEIEDYGLSLNSLISALSRSSSGNFDLIADGIFKLLLNVEQDFGITEKHHPGILLISSESNERMLYLSHKIEDIIQTSPTKAIKFLRPLLFMILCNDTIYADSREIWRQILSSNDETVANQILSLRRVTSPSSCLLFNSMITMQTHNFDNLLLLVASTKNLVENSLNPSSNLQLLASNSKVLLENDDLGMVVIFMLAEILQKLPASYISSFIRLIETLTQFVHHPVVNSMIIDGLIQVLAYPSFAGREISNVEKLLHRLKSNCNNGIQNKIRPDFHHYNADIMNAIDVCRILETTGFELKSIKTEQEKNFWTRNYLVLRGYFQSNELSYEQWKICLENLIEISKASEELKSSLVMPLLFKLAESHDARVKISILQNLTKLGASTEIFSTIKALSLGMVRSMSIDLHLRLWKVEPRTYPFLYKVLTEKSPKDDEDFHLKIAQTHAIKEICDLKPHHGSDLVSLISEILNQSLETKEAEIPAALAIDAITILCQNHIISIASTWRAINLTTRYEKRPRVVKSLCNFFALVPKFKRNNSEYEMLMKDILARLFNMIQWSDTHGISCALDAMKSWNYDQLTLDMIPDVYREGIALPDAPAGMEVSILDLEVPGECYVQLLMKVNSSALGAAGDLVSHFMAQEISEYRSGHYLVKDGQPEPMSYKNLPKQSIVKALTQFVIQQATTKKKEKIVDEIILIEALRVLAKRYSRPLPPLNWTFLHEMMHRDEKIKAQCVALSAKQAIISGTAKRLIENVLVNIDFDDCDDVSGALNCLVDICNGASSDVLKMFFERAVLSEDVEEKMENLLASEKNISNRENLAAIISIYVKRKEILSTKIISMIPPNIMHLISLTSTQKITFRCEILKAQAKVENSVAWMNELIQEEFIHDKNRQLLVTHLIDILTDTKQHFPSKKWLAEFITMVENKMIETGDFNYLLDIFCIALICLSGFSEITGREKMFENRFKIFPQATELLSRQLHFDDTIGSIFEFIHFVISRNTPSDLYQLTFRMSIVAAKNHPFFKKQKSWHKILQALVIV